MICDVLRMASARLMAFAAVVLVAGCSSSNTTSAGAGNPNPGMRQSSIDVITYHYDNLRTGQNTAETFLTPSNVNPAKFGKLGEFMVDGKMDAQPLYLSNVSIPGSGTRNVLYVVTENASVFAFDADSINGNTGNPLWKVSTLGAGEAPVDATTVGCDQVAPKIGITSTPVIDRSRGAIYVIAVSQDSSNNYFHRIHALDVTTGKELFGGPTVISATAGSAVFTPAQYKQRPGLLEINGAIYAAWGSHCDSGSYTSWVMSYSADTLKQLSVLNLVPNGQGGGIWMAGTAPAADAAGNIYVTNGNGTFDTTLDASGFPSQGDCGNCFAKISSGAPLKLVDYFTPSNTVALSNADSDLGSGGPLLLPDLPDGSGAMRHLALAAGKNNPNIYVVDRDNMGKFNSTADNIYQELAGAISPGGEFAKPSYFNNTVYYGAVGDNLKAFPIANAKLASTPSSQSAIQFGYPGTTPSISANGSSAGIVWAVENGSTGVLHAYDATNLATELYNSNQAAGGRDQFADNKFITPMVANGRVYVGTPSSVAVFGLLQ
jgi:hypothetical protein